MRRKTPMTRAELSEKIGHLTSDFGADAYVDGYRNGVMHACEALQDWAAGYPLLPGLMADFTKRLKALRKKGARR